MRSRAVVVLSILAGLLCCSAGASAAGIEPAPARVLTGFIHFPRKEGMTISTGRTNGSQLTFAVGFDGRCNGGGLSEIWASYVPARETVTVAGGHFDVTLTGTSHKLGGISGRTGQFTWRVRGHFTDAKTAVATVSGSAVVRASGKRIATCKITKAASVHLVS